MNQRNEWDSRNEGLVYEDGAVSKDATAFELIAHCTWDPRATKGDYIEQAVFAAADELSVIGESLESNGLDTEFRMVFRVANRLRVALEVAKRRKQAEATRVDDDPEILADCGLVPAEMHPWLAPTGDDGKPDFERARRATAEDMRRMGWVWYQSVSKAIGLLTQPQPETEGEATQVDNAAPEVASC